MGRNRRNKKGLQEEGHWHSGTETKVRIGVGNSLVAYGQRKEA